MVTILIWLAVAGAILGGTFAMGHKAGRSGAEAELANQRQQWALNIIAANERADRAALDYEQWKLKQKPRVVTIVKEVERVLTAPEAVDWSNTRVPDVVQHALATAAAELDTSSTNRVVPDPAKPEAGDQRRSSAGVPESAGSPGGLPEPTSEAL